MVGVKPTIFNLTLYIVTKTYIRKNINMARKLKTVEPVAEDTAPLSTELIADSNPAIEDDLVNPLLREQTEQAAQMRDALLTCRKNDVTSAKVALQNIAVLQVYHQVARIIRYTEMMDRLEDKLYASIDANLSQMDDFDPNTMILLTKIQCDLQKSMVLSQEMLKPYMDIDLESLAPPRDVNADTSFGAAIIPKESRNAIRNGAQALLTELTKKNPTAENPSENEETDVGTDTANTQ